MKESKMKMRLTYAISFLFLFVLEILIALFVHDKFIRPYVGDVLVTILICCFVRVFIPSGIKILPLLVFLFSALVEVGQYFNIVPILGLDGCTLIRVVLGTTYSTMDLVCYAVGCVVFYFIERRFRRRGV